MPIADYGRMTVGEAAAPQADEPIWADGDRPVGTATLESMLQQLSRFRSSPRRMAQLKRYEILMSRHRSWVEGRIKKEFESPDVQKRMLDRASVTVNPAADILRQVCAVWKHGAVRQLVGSGKQRKQKALYELIKHTHIDARAPEWNAIAYFVGPLLVFPRMRRGKVRLETVLPHDYVVAADAKDPYGPPVAAMWATSASEVCVADRSGYRYFSIEPGERLRPTRTEAHPHGRFPGAVLRFEDLETAQDWYRWDRFGRLVSGALDAAVAYTAMRFVRKAQNKKLLTVVGPVTGVLSTGTNTSDAELPIEHKVPTGAVNSDVSIDVHDFEVSPASWVLELRLIAQVMAEAEGVPVAVGESSDSYTIVLDHDGLAEVRLRQIDWAREFELELWTRAVAVANEDALPTREDLESSLAVEYPPLTRKFSAIADAIQWWEFKFSHGMASVIDLARSELPASDDVLRQRVEQNLDENATFALAKAKHNLPNEGEDVQKFETAPQVNGRQGPKVRDSKPDSAV